MSSGNWGIKKLFKFEDNALDFISFIIVNDGGFKTSRAD